MRKMSSVTNNDGSDMDYEGDTGYLPARLLNAYAELIMQTDDRNIISHTRMW